MKLAIIAAIARNHVIGRNGSIPWHISEDMRRFKRLTTGHAVLMGRKTFESLRKPLPNRRNVVLSSQTLPGVECYHSLPDALAALQAEPLVFIIGGASLYRQFLPQADRWYLTLVDQEPEGDTFFPPYEHLVGSTHVLSAHEQHEGFAFFDYTSSGSMSR